jgi:hypothetical protein
MKIRARTYMKPADDGASGGGGGGEDRGDDFVPTPDEPKVTPKADPAPKGEKEATAEEVAAAAETEAAAAAEAEAAEAEAAAAAAGEAGADGKKPAKDTRIPLARHKEVLERERTQREALQRELDTLRAGQAAAKTATDITASEEKVLTMEKEYLDLLAKGDVDKAAAKMAEIRRTERSIVQANATLETQAAEARAYERVKYDTTVERLEEAYPAINPDHPDFDKELTGEVVELRDGYLATGKYSRAEALQKACKTLLKTATKKQESAVEVDVRVDKDAVAKAAADARKATQVAKNLATADKQPANISTIGRDTDKAGGELKIADVMKMSQKDFAAIGEADLSRLRGDEV